MKSRNLAESIFTASISLSIMNAYLINGVILMAMLIIGRQQEKSLLKEIYERSSPDFLAIYGRRRVGKTYLIRNYFSANHGIYFEITGLKDGTLAQQLKLFTEKFSEFFMQGLPLQPPRNWLDAFKLLTTALKKIPAGKKIVLFFDELPWLAAPKSGFIQALDRYWNTEWSLINNMKLIVCGSAASWMLNQLIHAKGGLHNRLTNVIALRPFSLGETAEYLKSKNINLNQKQILELYMIIGGVPHYLNSVTRGLSAAQNINKLCFQKDGLLFNEFSKLFSSLFNDSEAHYEIIRIIAKAREGLSRDEILQKSTLSKSGGMFKSRLSELEEAGFIASFTPYGKSKKGTYFRIIDEYILFYLKWIEPIANKLNLNTKSTSYWESKAQTQTWKSWSGYAFEAVCLKHIEQIKFALGIQVIASEIGSWRHIPKQEEQGAQIDLLIDRADSIINLCEIKYCQGQYTLTKKYANELLRKLTTFQTQERINKTVFITLITPDGAERNAAFEETIVNEITLSDLFRT